MEVFKHNTSGNYYRMIRQREGNINTYLEVDELNVPIVKKRAWSCQAQEQQVIINGFKNLKKIKI